jgi:hypothetical protein
MLRTSNAGCGRVVCRGRRQRGAIDPTAEVVGGRVDNVATGPGEGPMNRWLKPMRR